ncbi:MAG: chloride channel protein [Acidobacteriaceae bacterium]
MRYNFPAPASQTKSPTSRQLAQTLRDLATFRHTLRKFLHFSENSARKAGVTPQQHQIMLGIAGFTPDGQATISQLAEFLQECHHSVVGLIERAQQAGLVRRTQDPHDRRIIHVSLTPKGRGVLTRLTSPHQQEVALIRSGLLGALSLHAPEPSTPNSNPHETESIRKTGNSPSPPAPPPLPAPRLSGSPRYLHARPHRWRAPHWIKLATGGFLTSLCGLLFLLLYPGRLVPLGPNYEAVGYILNHPHSSLELLLFGILKLAATLFTLAAGGVSAMFVPLFLTGGAFGTAFAQSIAHSPSIGLYAAVGMASFLSAGYKTPLAAVVFVAEATGGHAYIIPALIGAAIAYVVSGDASASADQRLHEGAPATTHP